MPTKKAGIFAVAVLYPLIGACTPDYDLILGLAHSRYDDLPRAPIQKIDGFFEPMIKTVAEPFESLDLNG